MNKELLILNNWEKAKNAIAECKTIDEVKDIRDKAEALRAYAKQAEESLEVQNNVCEIKLRAERRIGDFSKELPTAQGSRTDTSVHNEPKYEILKDAGIKNYQRYEAIADLPEEDFEEHIKAIKESNKELTTVGVIKLARKLNPVEVTPLKEIKGKYDMFVIDPPWQYGTEYNEDTRRIASPYPEKSTEEIKEWGIQNIAGKANDNSAIWLWTTHKFLQDAFYLLKEWGFEYKITVVWDKQKLGMGSWLRCQAEFCLLAVKGDFHKHWNLTNERDVISSPRREHSRKPDEFYEMIKRLCPEAKIIDIFSREKREGIEQYGNETTKF